MFKVWQIAENKVLEFQLEKYSDICFSKEAEPLISVEFDIKKKRDHPGFMLSVKVFNYLFIISFYDTRHYKEIIASKA
jgi:hypothetical protein